MLPVAVPSLQLLIASRQCLKAASCLQTLQQLQLPLGLPQVLRRSYIATSVQQQGSPQQQVLRVPVFSNRAATRFEQCSQQLRWSSGVSEAAKRRLLAAQQRRQRELELQKQQLHQQQQQRQTDDVTVPAAEERMQQSSSTALAPGESPPTTQASHDLWILANMPFNILEYLQIAAVVQHPALVVGRSIEWGTVILGYEQATKYTVSDEQGNTVALIAEELGGIGNEVQRQLLRTHRSFKSTVLSADGSQVVFRVRRPAYFINSYMYIEDAEGNVIGEVRQRWHPWRRKYDLFLGKKQFAAIDGPLLAWEFELKDANGNTLALIDRNFLGFAREIFTDAGKYVVHFGYGAQQAASMAEKTLAIRSGKDDVRVTPLAQMRTDVAVIPSVTGNQLVVQHPLPLDERMIALAAAISVDYNYFSQHSNSSGLISPPLFMPMPLPGGGGGAEGAAAGEAAAGDAAAGAGPAAPAAGAELGGAAAAGEATSAAEGMDSGFSSGFGSEGFGRVPDEAESFKWDDMAGGLEGSSSSNEGGSGLWGILLGIWAMVFGE